VLRTGSLAYIGSDKAVADLPFGFQGGNVAAGGQLTYYFWRSAYLSKLFSLRNRTLGKSSVQGSANDSGIGLDQGQGFWKGYFSCLAICIDINPLRTEIDSGGDPPNISPHSLMQRILSHISLGTIHPVIISFSI